MLEFIRKLTAVMFYASLPLLVPFAFGIINGDGGWVPIGATIVILALPAVPQIIMAAFDNLTKLITSFFSPETPFNYAAFIDLQGMRKQVETLTMGEILTVTSLAWIVVPLISTIPYTYYGVAPVDAFFESMSGWTTTGLSALPSLAGLPASVILFRSITQWAGGLGIVVLMLTLVRGKEAQEFLRAEGKAPGDAGVFETAGLILRTYLVLTVLGIGVLAFSGIGLLEGVNLTFSGISNGGFFPFDSFDFSQVQQLALAVIMFAGATSFIFYRSIWEGKPRKAFLDEEFVLYAGITALSIGLIILIGKEELFNTVLNAISSIASGGFAIGDLGILHDFSKYILILLMLSGGMLGSTCGGIKLWRILLIFKAIGVKAKAAFLPEGSIQVVKINGEPITEGAIAESAIFVFTYVFLFLFGAGVFIASNYSLQGSLFLVASALGNVGSSIIPVPAIGAFGKVFLTGLMYLGRIEIFPSLALVGYFLRR
jgi:trk system potassium uptake protein TrkH